MNQEKITELRQFIQTDYSNTAGIIVQKNGEILYEDYFNGCSATSRLHVYSVTKSIVSLLIGIAIDQGKITSVKQRVAEFFPEHSVADNVTLEHLLTMTASYGYAAAEPPYEDYFRSDNWVEFALDLLQGQGKFSYAPLIGPDILSGILMKVTGQSVLDFARENLFSPLGIEVASTITFHSEEEQMAFYAAKDISGWVADSTGVNAAGWGLTLTTKDMAKIGQLYLDEGSWEGKQIVSSQWIKESTAEQSRWQEMSLKYGYLWWVIDDKNRIFSAMGDGGNVIYVNSKKKMVVAIAGLFEPDAKDRLEFIREHIESFV